MLMPGPRTTSTPCVRASCPIAYADSMHQLDVPRRRERRRGREAGRGQAAGDPHMVGLVRLHPKAVRAVGERDPRDAEPLHAGRVPEVRALAQAGLLLEGELADQLGSHRTTSSHHPREDSEGCRCRARGCRGAARRSRRNLRRGGWHVRPVAEDRAARRAAQGRQLRRMCRSSSRTCPASCANGAPAWAGHRCASCPTAADEPSLTVTEVDQAFAAIAGARRRRVADRTPPPSRPTCCRGRRKQSNASSADWSPASCGRAHSPPCSSTRSRRPPASRWMTSDGR